MCKDVVFVGIFTLRAASFPHPDGCPAPHGCAARVARRGAKMASTFNVDGCRKESDFANCEAAPHRVSYSLAIAAALDSARLNSTSLPLLAERLMGPSPRVIARNASSICEKSGSGRNPRYMRPCCRVRSNEEKNSGQHKKNNSEYERTL